MSTENLKETTTHPEKINAAQELFINEMIAHGNRKTAYQTAYPGASEMTARVNACRLLSQPHIAARIREGILQARLAAQQLLKDAYEGRLTDMEEKRAILAQIIRGELIAEKEVVKGDETYSVRHIADPSLRLRAILIDNKMEHIWASMMAMPDTSLWL